MGVSVLSHCFKICSEEEREGRREKREEGTWKGLSWQENRQLLATGLGANGGLKRRVSPSAIASKFALRKKDKKGREGERKGEEEGDNGTWKILH